MIISIRHLIIFFCISISNIISASQTHEFNWTLSWISANPDGEFERDVIAINGAWPLPVVRCKQGDRIVINIYNTLNESTSLHFHGLFQKNSTFMDGASMISQCPIPPDEKFTYDFEVVNPSGTYWYHSHSAAQYGDGLRGAFIVEEDDEDKSYDDDFVITLSDWYHERMSGLVDELFTPGSNGAEPRIKNGLFNESKDVEIKVEPDKTHYLRIINVGMSASQYFYIDDHDLTIVEIDGVKVDPTVVDSLKLATGQRYGVLLKTKSQAEKNYPVVHATNIMMQKIYSVNWIIYDETFEHDKNSVTTKNVKTLNYIDDFNLKPRNNISLYGSESELDSSHHQIILDYELGYFSNDHIRYYPVNGKPFSPPEVPTINTLFSADPSIVSNTTIYGNTINPILIKKGDIIDIVVNSFDHMRHPFHLHGHNFQVLAKEAHKHFNPNETHTYPGFPMIRDTVEVLGYGYVVLRFIADNPGVWFFHCHTEWHAVQGLGVVFIEAPEDIVQNQILPLGNIEICEAGGFKSKGNAVGNMDFFNLFGENILTPFGEDVEEEEPPKTHTHTSHDEITLKTKTTALLIYCTIMISIVALSAYVLNRRTLRKGKKNDRISTRRVIDSSQHGFELQKLTSVNV